MLRFHALVFDDYIPGSDPVYTAIQHMKALGQGDQIGLFAVCDEAPAGGTLIAAIEHSTDGMNWCPKNPTPELNGVSIGMGQTTSAYGGEAYPTLHSLEYVRIRITVTLGRGVRVRLYASVRDRVTGKYASCGCAGEEEPASAGEGEPAIAASAGARDVPAAHQMASLLANRPEEALGELRRRLEGASSPGSLRERVQEALAAMGERERSEVAGFLEKVAALHPEARQELVRMGGASS